MNRLSKEKASYLRHSAYQKIEWYPWCDEAFEKAKAEDKPVFLSSGAVWCHWCHVMAKECFENDEIVKLLNENFINIKLDRDERPDIDKRYQHAVTAMGSGGGWPLNVFITPDKKPFFGGTYFPPDDSLGRPGFKKVLTAVVEFYKSKRNEVSAYSDHLVSALRPGKMRGTGINESALKDAAQKIISQFDPQNGGFGTFPKFPMPGAMEFLISRYFFTKDEAVGCAATKTLDAMSKGGFYDQLGGGFHRYSTDEAWIAPHFEKMADDNGWLLRNYIDAYRVFGNEHFKNIAKGIIFFINNVLSDPDGGFYASQDADITPDDEGGYFTWTEEDFKNTLDPDEYKILSAHLFHEKGAMHHDAAKRVLFIAADEQKIADETGMDIAEVREIISKGKDKLLNARNLRKTPFIDKTLYTSLNGMLISAYLKAYRSLDDDSIKDTALKSLDRIMGIRFVGGELFHSDGVKAMLEDYVYLIEALTAAYEVTGDCSYLLKSNDLMKLCIKKFWDINEGGFFDTEDDVIGLKLKGIEDIPHPSANSLGIMLLIKHYHLTNNNAYLQYAETALKVFSTRAKEMGIHSAYYYAAADCFFHMLRLAVYIPPQSGLAQAALSSYAPYTTISYDGDKGYILPCLRSECYEPVYTAEELKKFLSRLSPEI
jgi:uncharacterized protein YyaL (SSP411 family)